ncbi:MAG: FtsX-like permease family protein [candidate division WOR-3 bacterium]
MIWKLAFRNLWRNKRRTVLTISVMVMGYSFLVITIDIYEALFLMSIKATTDNYLGHITITKKGYSKDRSIYKFFKTGDLPNFSGFNTSYRVRGFGLFVCGKNIYSGEVLGVNFEREPLIKSFKGDDGFVIGKGLAKILECSVGDSLYVIGNSLNGSFSTIGGVINGIFSSGDRIVDMRTVFTSFENVREFLNLPDSTFHEVVIRLDNPLKSLDVAKKIKVGEDFEVKSWANYMPVLWFYMRMWDAFGIIYDVLFYFVVGLIIFNTFLISFYERRKEFAMLMAIGVKKRFLYALLFLENLYMGFFSLIIGLIISLAITALLKFNPIDISNFVSQTSYEGLTLQPIITALLDPHNFIHPALFLILLVIILTITPALGIKRLNVAYYIRERE